MFILIQYQESKKNDSSKLPGKIRWWCHLHYIKCLKDKLILQSVVVSEKANMCSQLKKNIVLDDMIWIRIKKIASILKPIVKLYWIHLMKLPTDSLFI